MSDKDKNSDHKDSESASEPDVDAQFEKPIIARHYNQDDYFSSNNMPYAKEKTEETIKEIQNQKVKPRSQIKMQFLKKRKEFGQNYKLNEQDANDKFQDIKTVNDPFMHAKNNVIDIGLQGSNPYENKDTQTDWYRKINKTLTIEKDEYEQKQDEDDKEIEKFLLNVYPQMEEALQSNETIDIFQNDFDLFMNQDDNQLNEGSELSNTIREKSTFYNAISRGKKISCIQFQPSTTLQKGKYICASFVENLIFEERIIYSQKSHKCLIILWEYDDFLSTEPALVLVSPLEILTFQFNPKDPTMIVGGAINGQIYMWNLQQISFHTFSTKKNQKSKQEKNDIPEIESVLKSALQEPGGLTSSNAPDILKKGVASHKNAVLSLSWLPQAIEIDRKNIHILNPNTTNEIHQFASISSDGQVLIWDKRVTDPKDSKKQATDLSQVVWKANYGIQLYRPEGGGQMGGSQICFRKNQKTSTFTGSSDEGEIFTVDWVTKTSEDSSKSDMVTRIWQNERAFRPTVNLECSPFFEDIILSVHDFHFCIWKHDVPVPIFESSVLSKCQITCGIWSPSRPGVVIIGRNDGEIDIWDFIDQSHKETLKYVVVSTGLTYLKFHDERPSNLAVGDDQGQVHILELPQTLWKKMNQEEKTMEDFWNREVSRVEYFDTRFKIREEDFKAAKEARDKELAAMQEEDTKKEDNKTEDQDEAFENEYQDFAEEYINQYILKIEPKKEKEEGKEKKK